MAADDPRHVSEAHHPLPLGVEHDVVEVARPLDLVDRPDEVLGLALLEPAAGEVHVLLGEARDHLVDAQAEARRPPLVDLDVDLLLEPARHQGGRHPLDPLE